MDGKIGVLAMQGAFAKHEKMIEIAGAKSMQVRFPEDLNSCSGLIIPGGESTTIARQLERMHMVNPIRSFASTKPIFGTCAGMILMSQESILSLLSLSVARNAYGRQSQSFSVSTTLTFSQTPFQAIFVRAPRISKVLAKDVRILASYNNEPILVQQGHHLASTFHPELTQDPRIHAYFLQLVEEAKAKGVLESTFHLL